MARLLVLPVVSDRDWTPTPVSFREHLDLTHFKQCPETLFIFLPKVGLGCHCLLLEKAGAGFNHRREKLHPVHGGLEQGWRGAGYPPPAGPRCSPPCRAGGERPSGAWPTPANFSPSTRRWQQMRQNEKYNDAYYINHPPFF